MPQTPQQIAALKELQNRRDSLSAEQQGALDELSRRYGLGQTQQTQQLTTAQQPEVQTGGGFAEIVGQPGATFEAGVRAIPENPLEAVGLLGSSLVETAALPFSIADYAVRKVPFVGEPIAEAVATPFRLIDEGFRGGADLIGQGLTAIGVSPEVQRFGLPEEKARTANEALLRLGGGVAQAAVPFATGKMLPKRPQAIRALPPEPPVATTTAVELPPSFKKTVINELQAKGINETRFGKIETLSDADLIRIAEENRVMTEAPLSEAPVSRGGDLGVRGAANEAQIKMFQERGKLPQDPIARITNLIKEAKPVRKEQEALYHLERRKRAAKLADVFEKESGEQAYFSALRTQRGELPKAQFESIGEKITQADVDLFHNRVKNSNIGLWNKLVAMRAIDKLFTKEGGKVPTQGEIALLEDVFGADFAKAVLDKRADWDKFRETAVDAANTPKTLMSAFDMSMPFRQGVIQVVSHPVKAALAAKDMHKAFFSEKAFKEINAEINARGNSGLYKEFKLDILDPDKQSGGLTRREEAFTSKLAERIPFIGRGVRMSNRAAHTFLNKLRADVFDNYAAELRKSGITPEKNPEHYQYAADWINISTGRGNFGRLTQHAPAANALMFSPRLLKSRFDAINPMTYIRAPKEVRVMMMKDMLKFVGTMTSLLTIAKAAGLQVETDPRGTDFAKIRIGNTRVDPWGGFQQIARFFAQMISGQRKTLAGSIKELDGKTFPPESRLDVLYRFGESKLNPHVSLLWDYLRGRTFVGEEFEFSGGALSRLLPMYIQDVYDAAKEEGLLKGAALTAPAFYGMGVSTIPPRATSLPDKTAAPFKIQY